MSQISSLMGLVPGVGSPVNEYQSAFTWGVWERLFVSGAIYSGAVDSGNSPTTTLRMGLVMGKIGSGANAGQWTNYSATATDGSQVAQGVLPFGLRMTDVITGTAQQRFVPIMVSGGLKSSGLIGLDNLAREDLRYRFTFDDDLAGRGWFPFKTFSTKTAAYQILAGDNQTRFDNLGATGAVVLTLPAIANGYVFWAYCLAAQTLTFTSTEGSNIVGATSLTNSSVSVNAIGSGIMIWSNAAATKWETHAFCSTAVSPTFA